MKYSAACPVCGHKKWTEWYYHDSADFFSFWPGASQPLILMTEEELFIVRDDTSVDYFDECKKCGLVVS